MGCTNSAPEVADAPIEATDAQADANKKSNGIRVEMERNDGNHVNSAHLNSTGKYTSDILNKNIQLPSYNSIFPNNNMEWSAKDTSENSLNNDKEENLVHKEEKLKTFVEVVDKVLETRTLDDIKTEESQKIVIESKQSEPEPHTTKDETNSAEESPSPEIIVEDLEETEIMENEIEHESPTHSECSRATRWEALADIAAELPPSMAVDPITGHIYSLTK